MVTRQGHFVGGPLRLLQSQIVISVEGNGKRIDGEGLIQGMGAGWQCDR
jgi:hypothetical protein